MHETRSTMRRSFSLRSHFALLIALLVTLLSWLLGSLIGNDASQRIREEVGRDLAEASRQMIDRLDSDMAGRSAYLQVLASLQVLRQPDDSGQIRTLLDHIHQQIPSVAWIGFTDARGQVLASSDGVLEGASITQRPVYLEGRQGLMTQQVPCRLPQSRLRPHRQKFTQIRTDHADQAILVVGQ